MSDLLTELTHGAREDAQARRAVTPLAAVEDAAAAADAPLDALAALAPADRVKIIAEVKRASPSRGDLADIPDPAHLASLYASGGASAISVLTEGRRFKGSLDDLSAVKQTVPVPVLRKDFVSDPYQVFEARAAGADMVLLIVAALDQGQLRELHGLVTDLGMTSLVEAHTAEELDRALELDAKLIGINARNLKTFDLDRDLFGTLSSTIPAGVVKVAESAVAGPDDVAHYREAGADVVLIGEALVTSDPVSTLHRFLAV
ncbi:indole-3-glycerol phosphate synthase TrpC [Paramicrobacterium agarici]|uniref:Indole-3-glycerol phosphate synthase n=1 Tax=Paramicrobacterium agarici TaxID=630514 RepID=A0A2A9DYY5_9MICO|nr:indole-3-glycerol phosphate synthase TrpC [Microbacterium agarici]PFG31335.1 indole-3-glycerol phosphate synthase [Microbacterium agarici]